MAWVCHLTPRELKIMLEYFYIHLKINCEIKKINISLYENDDTINYKKRDGASII